MENSLNKTCKDVRVDPSLTPLTGEEFNEKTGNKSNDVRLDAKARGFWKQDNWPFLI